MKKNVVEQMFVRNNYLRQREYDSLTTEKKNFFVASVSKKLFDSVKSKSLRIDYLGLEKTNGDFTAYPKYDDVVNSIDVLNRIADADETNERPKELDKINQARGILINEKNSFVKGFREDDELIKLVYMQLSSGLIACVSSFIASSLEFLTNDEESLEIQIKHNKDLTPLMKNLCTIIDMYNNGQLNRIFKNSGTLQNELNSDIKNESYVLIIPLVLSLATLLLVACRNISFFYFFSRVRTAERLLSMAYLLEAYTEENVDTSTPKGKKIKEKQLMYVEKLKALSDKINISDSKSNKESEAEVKKEDEKIASTTFKDMSDDIII